MGFCGDTSSDHFGDTQIAKFFLRHNNIIILSVYSPIDGTSILFQVFLCRVAGINVCVVTIPSAKVLDCRPHKAQFRIGIRILLIIYKLIGS